MVAHGKKTASARPLNPRQDLFAQLVAGGKTHAEAWRTAYVKPAASNQTAAEKGSRLAADARVQARVAQIRARSDVKSVLSLNDRLAILARDAQTPGTTAAMLSARARVIEVYNKTAGDQAPDRTETTIKGDPAAPVVVTSRAPTKAEKIAALAAQRKQRE